MKRALILLSLCMLLFSGCGSEISKDLTAQTGQAEPWHDTIFAMDTVMELQVYGKPELQEPIRALITRLEDLWSVTREGSEIAVLNRTGQAVLSPETETLLQKGLELCRRSGGAMDLSIYPVVRAWGFTTGDYQVPDEETLRQLCTLVDYTQIQVEEQSHTASIPSRMEIDLGSIAKGYTGDSIVSMLREGGVTSALLNLGGNVQALGSKPDGSPWRVAIRNPLGDGNLGVVEIDNQAVITSGGYERFFVKDGKTYWHIMDPETGHPADSELISVTIIGDQGVVCDGFSTALFVMGQDRATQFWQQSDDFEAIFVNRAGEILITEGLEEHFAPLDAYKGAEVTVIRHV